MQGTLLLVTIGLLAVRRNRASGSVRPEAAGQAESVASDVVIGETVDDDGALDEERA